ncbi:MAG: lipid-A-disaccharide synthase [Acidobacteriota bacterium]
MPNKLKIMVVAGEPSGDAHGARLVRALTEAAPHTEFEFFGAAGTKMRGEEVEAVVASDDLSIIGVAEIAGALPIFLNAMRSLRRSATDRRPDVAVLIDFPEFNLKLAKALKKRGIRVVYYISPQLWAWRKYRIRTVRKYVDLLLTILPFERQWYADRGVANVQYVGNPLALEVQASLTRNEFCIRHGLDPKGPIVSLLPGSRQKEISKILPVLIETAAAMVRTRPSMQFVIPIADPRHRPFVEETISGLLRETNFPNVTIVEGETYDALNASDAAAVASGTATLETGMIGTPMAIVYKTTRLNYYLLKPLISVEHYGLINLIAEKRLARELIQDEFTAETLATELFRLLDPEVNKQMRAELKSATEKLGHGGASQRSAKAILNLIT